MEMQHPWTIEIRTCKYHDGQNMPCETCENAKYDYQVEQTYEELREARS